ncbi:uncharacterized protein YALI1_D25006g [Yarrowia lipolytica]|uniref:Uncharacterized protein n=1 Tax=Yarrowia lipolytica TaxID=4952 RepID=A0A1D8NFB6_YARLL|nr:hypothetical protein YALI1_D25006g [Yarrowia lipolytica]
MVYGRPQDRVLRCYFVYLDSDTFDHREDRAINTNVCFQWALPAASMMPWPANLPPLNRASSSFPVASTVKLRLFCFEQV